MMMACTVSGVCRISIMSVPWYSTRGTSFVIGMWHSMDITAVMMTYLWTGAGMIRLLAKRPM
ncbi:hypothetical protein T484DRAFT_1988748, partial [Baffinella frigidus]